MFRRSLQCEWWWVSWGCQHRNAVCIIKLFNSLKKSPGAIQVSCVFNHSHGHQTTACLCSLATYWIFLLLLVAGWTLCVCWQLAHHNNCVSLPWLGLDLNVFRTLSLSAHTSFADDTDSISEGLHLLRPSSTHLLCRVFVATQIAFLSWFSINTSVPGRIIMVQSHQWLERRHVTEYVSCPTIHSWAN